LMECWALTAEMEVSKNTLISRKKLNFMVVVWLVYGLFNFVKSIDFSDQLNDGTVLFSIANKRAGLESPARQRNYSQKQ